MEYMEKIKRMLCKELEEYGEQKSISASDVEMIHKLTDTIKNLDKIEMLEDDGYSGHYPMYDDGVSYARRGTHYVRGHYSRDMEKDGYSDRRYDRRYSKDEAKDHMMNKLGEMMRDADPNEREALEEAMRKIERA
nr:MAG TPA: hypothetical protein [Caudoviricetes sp.]